MRRTRWYWAPAAMGFFLPTIDSRADEPQPEKPTPESAEVTKTVEEPATSAAEPPYIWQAETITGDWGGARTKLSDGGVVIELTSQTQFMNNLKGGLETHNGHDFAGTYDLNLLLDFERMFSLSGAEFFFRAHGSYGGEDSDFDAEKIGGLFATNNDAGPEEPIFVEKWWWRQRLLDDRIEIHIGRLTTDDIFDLNDVTGGEDTQFLNGALVINQTIPHRNGLGVTAGVWPTDWLNIVAGFVDADAGAMRTGFDTAFHGPNRAVAMAELTLAPEWVTTCGVFTGHYRFGTWYDPSPKEQFRWIPGNVEAPTKTGDFGIYFGADQRVSRESADPEDEQGLSIGARYGFAHGHVNSLEHFWSIGAHYVGLIPDRDNDVLGLAVAQGLLSNDYERWVEPEAGQETVIETYYAIHLAPWCVLTPDFQYVVDPGGNDDGDDAFVFGLRLRVFF